MEAYMLQGAQLQLQEQRIADEREKRLVNSKTFQEMLKNKQIKNVNGNYIYDGKVINGKILKYIPGLAVKPVDIMEVPAALRNKTQRCALREYNRMLEEKSLEAQEIMKNHDYGLEKYDDRSGSMNNLAKQVITQNDENWGEIIQTKVEKPEVVEKPNEIKIVIRADALTRLFNDIEPRKKKKKQ
jgi:hypothetical protein